MNQHEYEAAKGGESQATLILRRLCESYNRWVPMPELVRVSGAYAVHSRIADLRRRGHFIEQESVTRAGKVHSFYRIYHPSTRA